MARKKTDEWGAGFNEGIAVAIEVCCREWNVGSVRSLLSSVEIDKLPRDSRALLLEALDNAGISRE